MNGQKKKMMVLASIGIIMLVGILVYIYVNAHAATTFTAQVLSEQDDGRTFEVPATQDGFGNEPEDWANLEVNPTYSFGVRFNNITIPKGAIITYAYVRLYSIGLSNRNDHVNCTIYGDNVDNADDFYTKGCLDRCGRVYTQNYALWDAVTPFQQWVTTPNLKEILQEIIKRPGWEKDNSIAILFITQHTQDAAVFNNFNLGNAAELSIEFKT